MSSLDTLTGFLDRPGCLQAAVKLSADSADGERPLAAIWVNIARFKQINESFGHTRGDEVIKELALRIRRRISGRAELARVSGDEFVFLVPQCDRPQALRLAGELVNAVEEHITIDELTLRPTASVGIAIIEAGENSLTLLESAERAMFVSKMKGGGTIICAGDDQESTLLGEMPAREEFSIESSLHTALEMGGLCLYYQPIIHKGGQVEAVEALMRCSLDGGSIQPDKFIPVAEKTGLITRLGEWSLLQGAMYARRLQDSGYNIKVAINISRAQLISPQFTQALHAALLCSNVKPGLIELELTESLFMDNSNTVQMNLKNAIAAGVGLAIDDFGTGYSCLANLKDIPANKLKLDRAFVTVLPDDRRALSVVRAMTQLGHELGMSIVAEGCENQAQVDALFDAGVDAIQGFFYARPMPEELFLPWLQTRNMK